MNSNIDILDELHKGCSMGVDALKMLIPKVGDSKFKDLLQKQEIEYKDLSNRIDSLYKEYSDKEIHKTSLMEKAMTWYGIQMDTMMNTSISHIADILVKGTNMGIVEGMKILNNKTMDKKVHKIVKEYIKTQEAYLNKLEEFL